MFFLDEISDERRDEIIDWLAFRVMRYQMETPAVAFLEMSRPLSFIGSQAVHFFAPVADVLFGHPFASEVGFLMQDRSNIDRLVARIEELTKLQAQGVDISELAPDAKPGAGMEGTAENAGEDSDET